LYEEVENYKVFCETFEIDKHTDEISKVSICSVFETEGSEF
jgi:hypothetical protein